MNYIFIGVLVFIAYQLVKLNYVNKYKLGLNLAEKGEEKTCEFFPHFYPLASEGLREEIRGFVTQSIKENIQGNYSSADTDRNDLAFYIYLGRYRIIDDKINAQNHLNKKERMIGIKEDIKKELNRWDDKLNSMVDKGKMSEWEKSFVLWKFLNELNAQFPERYFELNDYFNSEFKIFINEKTEK